MIPKKGDQGYGLESNKSISGRIVPNIKPAIPQTGEHGHVFESNKSISGRIIPNTLMLLMCAVLSTAHTGETSYGRQPHMEVAKVKGLSPPGLTHEAMPPYKSHLYQDKQHIKPHSNVKTNIVKVDTDVKGLRIVTINVTSWSPKIITMISKMAK